MDAPNPQPPAPSADTGDSPSSARRHKLFIYTTLTVTVVLAVTLIVLTGLEWITQRTPTSIVVFHISPALQGGSITLTNGESDAHPRVVKITDAADPLLPVFLESGTYDVTVRYANDRLFFRDSMYVAEGSRYDIDITRNANTRR
ncbi:hypothetical protein BH10PLA1_BH10PLA1_02820 [soil metagenome]